MAKKEKIKRKLKDLALDTRILATFALLEFCHTNVANVSKDDFNELYQKVNDINDKMFEDEKAFELATKFETDQINSVEDIKERMQRNRVLNTYKQFGYFGLCSGKEREHLPEAPEVLSTIMYEAGIKNADEISVAIVKQELNDEQADKLYNDLNARRGSLKKQLAADFQTYKDSNTANPLIEDVAADISEYTFDKNKTLTYGYDIRKEQLKFRAALRDSFNNGCKPEFLKLCGQMLTAGKNISRQAPIDDSYQKFKTQIAAAYGEDAIDKILNISHDNGADKEKNRKAAYAEKSSELYNKTMAAILSQKWEYNQRNNIRDCDYKTYVKTIEDRYIPDLCRGFNNVDVLAFQDADDSRAAMSRAAELRLNREKHDETAEQQIVSVHHQIPISTIYDVYDAIKPTTAPEKKQAECDAMVNVFSNMIFVIGREKHQSLEPTNNQIKIARTADATMFAAEVNPQAMKGILHKLPSALRDGIKKYVKIGDDNKKIGISVNMMFPEPEQISNLRKTLEQSNHVSLLSKIERYHG